MDLTERNYTVNWRVSVPGYIEAPHGEKTRILFLYQCLEYRRLLLTWATSFHKQSDIRNHCVVCVSFRQTFEPI
jgi:hypothetical protein